MLRALKHLSLAGTIQQVRIVCRQRLVNKQKARRAGEERNGVGRHSGRSARLARIARPLGLPHSGVGRTPPRRGSAHATCACAWTNVARRSQMPHFDMFLRRCTALQELNMSNCKRIAEDVILKTAVLFQGVSVLGRGGAAFLLSVLIAATGNLMLRESNHGPSLCDRLGSVGASMYDGVVARFLVDSTEPTVCSLLSSKNYSLARFVGQPAAGERRCAVGGRSGAVCQLATGGRPRDAIAALPTCRNARARVARLPAAHFVGVPERKGRPRPRNQVPGWLLCRSRFVSCLTSALSPRPQPPAARCCSCFP